MTTTKQKAPSCRLLGWVSFLALLIAGAVFWSWISNLLMIEDTLSKAEKCLPGIIFWIIFMIWKNDMWVRNVPADKVHIVINPWWSRNAKRFQSTQANHCLSSGYNIVPFWFEFVTEYSTKWILIKHPTTLTVRLGTSDEIFTEVIVEYTCKLRIDPENGGSYHVSNATNNDDQAVNAVLGVVDSQLQVIFERLSQTAAIRDIDKINEGLDTYTGHDDIGSMSPELAEALYLNGIEIEDVRVSTVKYPKGVQDQQNRTAQLLNIAKGIQREFPDLSHEKIVSLAAAILDSKVSLTEVRGLASGTPIPPGVINNRQNDQGGGHHSHGQKDDQT